MVTTLDIITDELFEYIEDNFDEPENYDSYDEMRDDILAQEYDICEYCANNNDWADCEPENILPIAAEFMSEMEYDRKDILKYIVSYDTMVLYAYFKGFDAALAKFMSNYDDYDFYRHF